jgi:hypothetical protein
MSWLKPQLFEKKKNFSSDTRCPWDADCPSYWREVKCEGVGAGPDFVRKVKREVPLPQKLMLIEQVQPYVRLYKCGYCGMKFFRDIDGRCIPEEQRTHLKNPALIGGARGDVWR